MGFGGISIWSLLLILVIVMLIFGTKKLRNMGTDLGGAIKGFKSAMNEGENADKKSDGEERLERSEGDGSADTGTTSSEQPDEKHRSS